MKAWVKPHLAARLAAEQSRPHEGGVLTRSADGKLAFEYKVLENEPVQWGIAVPRSLTITTSREEINIQQPADEVEIPVELPLGSYVNYCGNLGRVVALDKGVYTVAFVQGTIRANRFFLFPTSLIGRRVDFGSAGKGTILRRCSTKRSMPPTGPDRDIYEVTMDSGRVNVYFGSTLAEKIDQEARLRQWGVV